MWTIEDVGKHWDETTDYDEINKNTYAHFRRFTDGYGLSNFRKIKGHLHVLDICSRTGNGTKYFHSKKKNTDFVLMDCTKMMMRIAKKNVSEIKHDLRMFNSEKLPGKNNEFDYILCFETLEHMPNPRSFLEELYRMLKPKGEMILTCPNPKWEFIHWITAATGIHHSEGPHKFIHYKKIMKMFNEIGFKILKFKTLVLIPFGPKVIINLGEWIEKKIKYTLMTTFGLRYIFIVTKNDS